MKKPIEVDSYPTPDDSNQRSLHYIKGEPKSKIVIEIGGEKKQRKLSKANGLCLFKTKKKGAIKVSYLD